MSHSTREFLVLSKLLDRRRSLARSEQLKWSRAEEGRRHLPNRGGTRSSARAVPDRHAHLLACHDPFLLFFISLQQWMTWKSTTFPPPPRRERRRITARNDSKLRKSVSIAEISHRKILTRPPVERSLSLGVGYDFLCYVIHSAV